ncbi:hypothetical protein A1O1_02212 [Capronia coronata CBS 617.96]|uniref:Thioesterase n=1 Tax=Capronia coronata CBS 617.96 TaxID=1182541 RepID=W9ZH45_9EURO|nr:uncharacterized protein A1O1_02212 [Capronia coronata CBS 617.96]EXJ93819.1 hypothetical protein A1O1_02212 [Capronia coronata CBS 617.96]
MSAFFMPSISSLAWWRITALVFALINLKALPLAWHFRLLYRMISQWYTLARVQRTLTTRASASTTNKTHPLFEPVSIFSRAPFLETDYNLHKSNSTYFSDLDESRTALMTKVLIPGLKRGSKNLEKEGHKGRLGVILGSVHTSFHHEIKPYERYEVRSRVLTWDRKWIVVGSWFIRPARKGREEVVLASALSKYVIKKGRFTVAPERGFANAGWLPEKPDDHTTGAGQKRESSDDSETALSVPTPEGIPEPVLEAAVDATAEIVEKLEDAAEKVSRTQPAAKFPGPVATRTQVGEWDWHRIEKERVRGLRVAANWLALDKELLDEFMRE